MAFAMKSKGFLPMLPAHSGKSGITQKIPIHKKHKMLDKHQDIQE